MRGGLGRRRLRPQPPVNGQEHAGQDGQPGAAAEDAQDGGVGDVREHHAGGKHERAGTVFEERDVALHAAVGSGNYARKRGRTAAWIYSEYASGARDAVLDDGGAVTSE